MSKTFNVNEYWLKRGRTYIGEGRLSRDYHLLQEQFLIERLHGAALPVRKILELGCGFGRITRLLGQNFPDAQIVALDLSPDQLANAQRYCNGAGNVRFEQFDFYARSPFPGVDYDVAIAVEVFLHHPPELVRTLIQRLGDISQFIVNLDWSEDWPWKTPPHVWVHEYPPLYGATGRRCATFPLPQKVDGMQQKLFISAKELTPELLRLEENANRSALASPAPSSEPSLSGAAEWYQDLGTAVEEIRHHVPLGSTFILVDDDQWGSQEALNDFSVLPFLEHGGKYWGPPADDATALLELERLRQSGASHVVFAWPSFWWLDHYFGLKRHLQATCPCLLANERLIVFRLES